MNVAAKRELLGTLRLDAPNLSSVAKPSRTRLRIGFALSCCAAVIWLAFELGLLDSTPTEAVQLSTAEPSALTSRPVIASPSAIDQPTRILLQAAGYITASQSATVSARTTAVVKAVFVEAGEFVEEGALLAQLDDRLQKAEYKLAVSQYEGAKTQMVGVKAELASAKRRMTRVKLLADSKLASMAELDEVTTEVELFDARLASLAANVRIAQEQIQLQRIALQDFEIRAPFDGVVTERSAQPGEIVSPISAGGGFTRTGIATLVNLDSLEIEVDVNETHIGKVTANHKVEVVLTAYPKVTYHGQVIAIIPRGDRSKGTVKVRAKLLDGDTRVFPQMGVRVDFLST